MNLFVSGDICARSVCDKFTILYSYHQINNPPKNNNQTKKLQSVTTIRNKIGNKIGNKIANSDLVSDFGFVNLL